MEREVRGNKEWCKLRQIGTSATALRRREERGEEIGYNSLDTLLGLSEFPGGHLNSGSHHCCGVYLYQHVPRLYPGGRWEEKRVKHREQGRGEVRLHSVQTNVSCEMNGNNRDICNKGVK